MNKYIEGWLGRNEEERFIFYQTVGNNKQKGINMFGLALLFYYGYQYGMGGIGLNEQQAVTVGLLSVIELCIEFGICMGLYRLYKNK